MSTDSSVSPDLRTALEALIVEWREKAKGSSAAYELHRRHLYELAHYERGKSDAWRFSADNLLALLVSHPPSPPPATDAMLLEMERAAWTRSRKGNYILDSLDDLT